MRSRVFLILLCFMAGVAHAENVVVPANCAPPDPRARDPWEVGLSLQNLLPNGLDDFDTSLIGYGPSVGIPLGGDVIQLGGLYGFSGGLTLHIIDAVYRLHVRTPFLAGFVMAGVHFLHYSQKDNKYDLFGGNTGLGLLQDLSDSFSMSLVLRIYIQKRAVLSVGGGFTFLL